MHGSENENNKSSSLSSESQELLLHLQREILEAVAINNDHPANLTKLCLSSEKMLPNSAASIMLFDDTRHHLNVRVAPSLPENAIQQLNGLVPGPNAGSCGTAMYCRTPIFVEDTATDPHWADFSQFRLDFNAQACWSIPIILPGDEMIGSFALTSFENRAPTEFQKKLLSVCGHLAGIILQREQMEKNLWNMAHLDTLTMLPNRALLNQRLNHAIETASRQQHKIAVLFLDLDHFKNINDSYGHTIGDEVLITAGNIMRDCIREQDTLARIGGDEFVILLENISDSLETCRVAEKILSQLSQIPPIDNANTTLTASIGISIYPNDATTVDEILRNADTAMYQAKKNGRNDYSYYEPALTYEIQKQLEIEAELRHALTSSEFELYYQPIFASSDNKVVATEALIRWNHPEKGQIPPGIFIPISEKSELIGKIGTWVLKNACSQGREWLNEGFEFERISVNLSIRQLISGCCEQINAILNETSFPANKLELEITETLLMEKGDIAISELAQLQALGISIAMDDFGTGYSSLHQIRTLPLNKLKIDRSFIMELPDNQEDVILAKMIISMGKNLSLKVVAEGVETEEQRQFLLDEGCDLLQGFLLGKPMPAIELQQLFSKLA